jgi:hypothetical protein
MTLCEPSAGLTWCPRGSTRPVKRLLNEASEVSARRTPERRPRYSGMVPRGHELREEPRNLRTAIASEWSDVHRRPSLQERHGSAIVRDREQRG